MLKPVVSIFSLYWCHAISQRRDKLLSNLRWAGILGKVPFLFFPFISNVWLIIGCAAFHMMLHRGTNPAWMEIIKLNIPKTQRGRTYSFGAVIGYIEGAVLAIGIGTLLDYNTDLWKFIFPIAALIGIVGVILQTRLKLPKQTAPKGPEKPPLSFADTLLTPWQETIKLLRRRPDFFRFQWGFILAGSGLMLIQPALPIFFADILKLSYTEMMIALSICKGVGYALTSQQWAKIMSNLNIFKFTSLCFFMVALYTAILISSQLHVALVYLAYFVYGIFLSGNHLSWNLSGPIFSHQEDSAIFSSVNVVTVGLRGCIAPPLGGILCVILGPISTIVCGMCLILLSAVRMYTWSTAILTPVRQENRE